MRAAWYEWGGPAREVLTVGEMEDPRPGRGEVLVHVYASGVNPGETKKRSDWVGLGIGYPRVIPHSDGAGIVEGVGEGVPPSRVGERVWVWGAQSGRPFGTAAEYVAVPGGQAVGLPDGVGFETGACLGIPARTAHRCVFADGSVSGETVLVAGGAGAVGGLAVSFAKWGGAGTIATVGSEGHAEAAREAGADHILNYRAEDVAARVGEITGGAGVARVVEVALGRNVGLDNEVLSLGGTIAAYASDAEPEPKLPFWELLFKNATIPKKGASRGKPPIIGAAQRGSPWAASRAGRGTHRRFPEPPRTSMHGRPVSDLLREFVTRANLRKARPPRLPPSPRAPSRFGPVRSGRAQRSRDD